MFCSIKVGFDGLWSALKNMYLATHVRAGNDMEEGSIFLVKRRVIGDKIDVILHFQDGMTSFWQMNDAAALWQDLRSNVGRRGVGGNCGEADENVETSHEIVEMLHGWSVSGRQLNDGSLNREVRRINISRGERMK